MLSEEVKKYRELSGDDNPNTPISRIGGYLDGYERAMEHLPSVPDTNVGKMPCEDAISRQAVRHILNHEVKLPIKAWKKVFELVDDLPPVTPAEKVGRWISLGTQGEIDGQIVRAFTCLECGAISIFRMVGGEIVNGDLCPNCGAKMQEVEG